MPPLPPPRRWLVVVLLSSLVTAVALLAPGLADDAPKGKKYALLVGVKDYRHPDLERLSYTENDVVELASVLKGFTEVVVLTTSAGEKKAELAPTAKNIRTQLKRLLEKVTRHDTMLVGLAGHGLQLKLSDRSEEEGFFCPADSKPREDVTFAEQSQTMISFSELFKELKESYVGVKLLLVDACRNNPKAGRSVNADTIPLARAPSGLAALFSCSSGERAFETDKLGKGHGVFFHHVIEGLKGEAKNRRGEVTWDSLAEYVKEQVSDDVPRLIGKGAKQTPEERKTLKGKAPVLIASLGGGAGTPGREKVVEDWGRQVENSVGMKLTRIKAGKFTMGSPADEKGREPFVMGSEEQHEVEITKDYWLGVTEVTQKQFKAVMGYNPSFFSADGEGKTGLKYLNYSKPAGGKDKVSGKDTADFPVENVSWIEADDFCRKLSGHPAEQKAGRKYRLPTEAEWEYACRGGASSYQVFHFGNSLSSSQANFNGDYPYGDAGKGPYPDRPCKVGSYKPNKFGLFDMHGNVSEWCLDWYAEDYSRKSPGRDPQGPSEGSIRVVRGGDWSGGSQFCRSADRSNNTPAGRSHSLGFRVALVPLAR
jgi:formylglycine-generating enzyme required for sulfatase activity